MTISVVVAISQNNVIGKDNQLLWKLSDDLKQFKALTSNHVVIMGRKTYDSIGRPLPNRTNIVISRSPKLIEGCIVANSFADALQKAKAHSETTEEVFVIGGEMIYKLADDFANKLYITKVNVSLEGDAFFDPKPYENWEKISSATFDQSEKNQYDFTIEIYQKP